MYAIVFCCVLSICRIHAYILLVTSYTKKNLVSNIIFQVFPRVVGLSNTKNISYLRLMEIYVLKIKTIKQKVLHIVQLRRRTHNLLLFRICIFQCKKYVLQLKTISIVKIAKMTQPKKSYSLLICKFSLENKSSQNIFAINPVLGN